MSSIGRKRAVRGGNVYSASYAVVYSSLKIRTFFGADINNDNCLLPRTFLMVIVIRVSPLDSLVSGSFAIRIIVSPSLRVTVSMLHLLVLGSSWKSHIISLEVTYRSQLI